MMNHGYTMLHPIALLILGSLDELKTHSPAELRNGRFTLGTAKIAEAGTWKGECVGHVVFKPAFNCAYRSRGYQYINMLPIWLRFVVLRGPNNCPFDRISTFGST